MFPIMSEQNCAQEPFDLLVLAPNSWRGQWVNRQHLFSRIGLGHQVLYSTGGWFTWDRNTPSWNQASWLGDLMPCDNVWIDHSPRYLLRIVKLPLLDALISKLQVRRWKRFFSKRDKRPLVAYIYHPKFLPYVKWINADYLVYHAYDLYDHTPGWDSTLEKAECSLLRMADLVVASSDQIAAALRKKEAREIRVLPNGADIQAFNRALEDAANTPEDLKHIPHPRLGWVGSLHPQVDYSLIAELAKRRPEWNFVLVGQVVAHADARGDAERAECEILPNVHFLGSKQITEIPKYLVNMDVNLMIYRLSEQSWIKTGYPLKLHEYLAVGHPVVSADLPSVRPFSKVVRVAEGVDDWHAAIQEALEYGGQGTPEQRKHVASENSWDHRADSLNEWLIELVNNGKRDL